MTATNFGHSLALTLVYEGLYSNNPRDPGGATMCGITQLVYDQDREERGLPPQSVKYSTEAERASIYRRRYWGSIRGDDLGAGIDYAVFDFAVNSGVRRAVKTLQRMVGAVQDGSLGSATLARVAGYATTYGATALTDAICQRRMQFLQGLPTFDAFGDGWRARVMGATDGAQVNDTGVIDRAFVMAGGGMPTAPAQPLLTVKTFYRPEATA